LERTAKWTNRNSLRGSREVKVLGSWEDIEGKHCYMVALVLLFLGSHIWAPLEAEHRVRWFESEQIRHSVCSCAPAGPHDFSCL